MKKSISVLITGPTGVAGSGVLVACLKHLIKNSRKMFIQAEDMGKAMINASVFGSDKQTLENSDIRSLAEREI